MKKLLFVAILWELTISPLSSAVPCSPLAVNTKEPLIITYEDCTTGESVQQEIQASGGETISWSTAQNSGAKPGSTVNVIWQRFPIKKNVASVKIDKELIIDCTQVKEHSFPEVCTCFDGQTKRNCPTDPNVTQEKGRSKGTKSRK